MLKSIIRTLLQKFIDDIDSDNCNITMATLQLTTEDVDAITTLFGVKKGGNYVITYLY